MTVPVRCWPRDQARSARSRRGRGPTGEVDSFSGTRPRRPAQRLEQRRHGGVSAIATRHRDGRTARARSWTLGGGLGQQRAAAGRGETIVEEMPTVAVEGLHLGHCHRHSAQRDAGDPHAPARVRGIVVPRRDGGRTLPVRPARPRSNFPAPPRSRSGTALPDARRQREAPSAVQRAIVAETAASARPRPRSARRSPSTPTSAPTRSPSRREAHEGGFHRPGEGRDGVGWIIPTTSIGPSVRGVEARSIPARTPAASPSTQGHHCSSRSSRRSRAACLERIVRRLTSASRRGRSCRRGRLA